MFKVIQITFLPQWLQCDWLMRYLIKRAGQLYLTKWLVSVYISLSKIMSIQPDRSEAKNVFTIN